MRISDWSSDVCSSDLRSWKGPGLGEGRRIMNGDSSKPIGHQYALAMMAGGEEKVRSVALAAGSQLTMDALLRVPDEEPVPAVPHTAHTAMSLPTERTLDEPLPVFPTQGPNAMFTNPSQTP